MHQFIFKKEFFLYRLNKFTKNIVKMQCNVIITNLNTLAVIYAFKYFSEEIHLQSPINDKFKKILLLVFVSIILSKILKRFYRKIFKGFITIELSNFL